MTETNNLQITNLLFVYGTLMQAAANPYAVHLHANSTFVGRAYFTGRLFRVGWYPGAVYDSAAATLVHGEVYALQQPAETLSLLDEYEGLDGDVGEYLRVIVPVSVLGQTVDCWVYVYNYPTANLVQLASGDFREYLL